MEAARRGGGVRPVSLDGGSAEQRYRSDPADDLTPETLFEKQWALALLDRALERLGSEQNSPESSVRFSRLRPHLTGEETAEAYREVAEELGTTEGAIRVAMHRLRSRYLELLREEIADTVADPGDVDSELRHLLTTLGG